MRRLRRGLLPPAAPLPGVLVDQARGTPALPAAVRLDMPVELTFRRVHEGEEPMNRFWTLRPV